MTRRYSLGRRGVPIQSALAFFCLFLLFRPLSLPLVILKVLSWHLLASSRLALMACRWGPDNGGFTYSDLIVTDRLTALGLRAGQPVMRSPGFGIPFAPHGGHRIWPRGPAYPCRGLWVRLRE